MKNTKAGSSSSAATRGGVTKLMITSRYPLADGKTFDAVGAYERIDGIAYFAADPLHPANSLITDLKLAPRDAAGLVHFNADFRIYKPLEAQRGNHRLFLDIVNRGISRALANLNSAPDLPPAGPPDLGNGFLMRQGYTIALVGCQHDVSELPGLLGLRVPEAVTRDGPICGRMAVTFQTVAPSTTQVLADRLHRPYPTHDLDDPAAAITVQDHEDAPERIISREKWSFARADKSGVVPDARHVYMASGFAPGKIYQVIYTAVGAPVAGCGLLSTRDFAAFLRYGTAAEGNPCAGDLKFAYAFGASQSGRFMRDFLHLGLNQDAQDRTVFDGCIAHVAGGRHSDFNSRFAQPSSQASRTPCNRFPFSDIEQTDPLTGHTDGLLSRLAARGKLPKVMHTYTSAEYWAGHGALVHIDVTGTRDLEVPEAVRVYHFAGSQHFPKFVPQGYRGTHPFNCVDWRPLVRAALVNLDRWVTQDQPAPPSRHPRLKDDTAVSPQSLADAYCAIPGVDMPEPLRCFWRMDFGDSGGVPTHVPPKIGAPYPCLVPALDADRNDVCGIRLPIQSVPVATFTGWNVRHADIGGEGQLLATGGASGGCVLGATIAFPATREARAATNDPRRSIAERYASRADYEAKVRQAALDLVGQRYLLDEDVDDIVATAATLYDALCSPHSANNGNATTATAAD